MENFESVNACLLTPFIDNICVRYFRSMDHQNLCKFIGGCVEVPSVCILTEYCPKGSLSDVLLNEDVPLSWAFRYITCFIYLFIAYIIFHLYDRIMSSVVNLA